MENIRKRVVQVLQLIMGLILLAMIVCNFVQMLTRYFISVTVVWVEDFSILGLYWIFALGVPMAWLVGAHMEMNILEKVLTRIIKKVILYLTQGTGIYLGVMFIRSGCRAITLNKGRVMSIMGFDEMWRYIPLVVCGILLIACVSFHTVTMVIADIRGRNSKSEPVVEAS